MQKKTIILGHTVKYEENAKQGIIYLLQRLDPHETKVFFDQAFSKQSASFEDQMGYNYKLVHNGSEYQLTKQ